MPEKYHTYFPCKCFADLLDKGESTCLCVPEILIVEEQDGEPVERVPRPYYRCKYVVTRSETWCSRCWDYGCDKENRNRQPTVIEIHIEDPPKASPPKPIKTPKAKKTSGKIKTSKSTKSSSSATPGTAGRDPPLTRHSLFTRFNQDPSPPGDPPARGVGGFTPISSPGSRGGGFTPVNSPSTSTRASRRVAGRGPAARSTAQETEAAEPTREEVEGAVSRGNLGPSPQRPARRGLNRTL